MPVPRPCWIVVAVVLAGAFCPSRETAAASPDEAGWLSDFESAEAEAQRLGRPLLIHFYADWCIPCRRMDRDVLRSPELSAHLKRNFVGVKVDADREPDVLKKYGVRSLPADVVVTVQGQVVIQTRGYQEKRNYLARLDRLSGRLRPQPNEPLPSEPEPGTRLARKENRLKPEPPPEPITGLDGYSPVSLFNWREWRTGKTEFTGYHKGVAYKMATQTELEEFRENPDKYVPRLLGCDPVILQKTDRAVPGSTKYGAYFDGALYLFESADSRSEFKKAPMRYVKTRHVLNADEIERGGIRQSQKPAGPGDPVRQ